MKFSTSFAFFFACLITVSIFFVPQPVSAKKLKKKTLIPLLLGVLLASKEKFKPLPLPIPIPLPIKDEKVIPYPEPYHYPVYLDQGYGGGYGGGYGHGGGHGDYAASGSSNFAQYAVPPAHFSG
ncbi:hypothetical protein SSS_02897 [Sarcoptes scabiei]|uniref:Uncharacterized protein n=1 Tax=Sarcoptes scabiei TaxID=52283 RepID=A0A131ZWM7_SARSC|nr:hypothetical protein SSS_02897 [Sarcoptes scabiei]KPM03278.1 hypothetical protein QR98_0017080 [Sarcoptes scabiei]